MEGSRSLAAWNKFNCSRRPRTNTRVPGHSDIHSFIHSLCVRLLNVSIILCEKHLIDSIIIRVSFGLRYFKRMIFITQPIFQSAFKSRYAHTHRTVSINHLFTQTHRHWNCIINMPVVCSCCCCFVQCYDIAMRCDYIYGCSNADSIFLAHSPERITTLNAQLYAGLMLFVFCAFFFSSSSKCNA